MIPESSADDAAHLHRDGCRIEKLRQMFQSLAGTPEGECEMGSESCGGNRISGDTFTVTDVPYAPGCSIFFFNKGAG